MNSKKTFLMSFLAGFLLVPTVRNDTRYNQKVNASSATLVLDSQLYGLDDCDNAFNNYQTINDDGMGHAIKLYGDITTSKVNKVKRILHVHSASDIEDIPFDKSKVNNGSYEINISKLSEFAFISEIDPVVPPTTNSTTSEDTPTTNPVSENKACSIHWIMICLVAALAGFSLLHYFFNEKRFEFNLLACIVGCVVLLANMVLGIIGIVNACVICIVMLAITVFAIGGGAVQHMRQPEKKIDDEE